MNKTKRVTVESPLRGTPEFQARAKRYARWCCRDAYERFGEQAMASHLLYTQFLDDSVEEERDFGIQAGLDWARAADARRVYYLDLCEIVDLSLKGPEIVQVMIPAPPGGFPDSVRYNVVFSTGMKRAWDDQPGECRFLQHGNPHAWSAFMKGFQPRHTTELKK